MLLMMRNRRPIAAGSTLTWFIRSVLTAAVLSAGLSACVRGPVQPAAADDSHKNEISAQGGWGRCFIRPDGMPARRQTDFFLHCDDSALHIRAVCLVPPDEPLRIGGKKPDDMGIFSGECVEIFLCTSPAKGIYYQFAVSPNGCAYTARGHDRSWEPAGWSRKVRREKDRWILELVLPYRIFGIGRPEPGEVWGLHFARTFSPAKGDSERSRWCDIADYHDFRNYNRIVFGPVKAVPQVMFDDFRENGTGEVRAHFILENIADPVELSIHDGGREFRKEVPAHTGKCSVRGIFPREYIPLKDDRAYSVSVWNVRTGKKLFQRNISSGRYYSDLLLPDKLYYVPADGEIRFTLGSAGVSALKIPRDFTVTLASGGRILRKAHCSGKGSFPLAGLKPGRYVLEASAGRLRTGRVVFLLPEHDPVSGLVPGAPFRIDGRIFTAGRKPVFLVGGSSTGKPLPKEICFNLNAGNFGAAPNSVRLLGLPGKRYVRKLGCYLYPYSAQDEFFRLISRYLKRYDRKTPKFFRMTYEAQIKTCFQSKGGPLKEVDSTEWHKVFYRYLKKNHPGFYYSLQTDKRSSIPELAPHCDIFEVTPAGGYSKSMLPPLLESLPEARRHAGEKPLICWLGATIPDHNCRTAEELRCAVYYNIIQDSAGVIFHLGHGAMPQSRTRMWSFLKHINGEIQRFYPAFRSMAPLSGEQASDVLKVQGSLYECAVRGDGSTAIAIVLNRSAKENVLKIQAGSRYVVTDRFQTRLPASFEWKCTPYEAAVFLLRKTSGD